MKPANWIEILRYLSLVTGIGVTFVAAVLIGGRLGAALQDFGNWDGWFLIGLISGIIAGIYTIYLMLKKMVPWE